MQNKLLMAAATPGNGPVSVPVVNKENPPLPSAVGSSLDDMKDETITLRIQATGKSETWSSGGPITPLHSEKNSHAGRKDGLTAAPPSILTSWLGELALCIISLMSLIVIVVVLRHFDNKRLTTLPMSITLNTFLAFFTTLTKAAFMVSVAESISQLKWNLLKQNDRPLQDFVALDNASRGVQGSLSVILRLHAKHPATLGALISILGLVTSPVTQQLVSYAPEVVPSIQSNETATIQRASYFGLLHPVDIIQPVLEGQISSPDEPHLPVSAICSSTMCTFPRYKSLGFCSSVRNVTSFLSVQEIPNSNSNDWYIPSIAAWDDGGASNGSTAWNASLPNGISVVTPLSFSMVTIPMNKSLAVPNDLQLAQTAIAYIYVVWSDAGNVSYRGYDGEKKPWQFYAAEIALNLCVNTYNTEFHQPDSTTTVINSTYIPASIPGNQLNLSRFCVTDGMERYNCLPVSMADKKDKFGNTTLSDPDDPSIIYTADSLSLLQTGSYLGDVTSGLYMWDGLSHSGDFYRLQENIFVAQALWNDGEANFKLLDVERQFRNLETYYRSVATSLSNWMRTSANETVKGTVWREETFVRIRWSWLIFLSVQLIMSICLLLITMMTTRKLGVPILKSSALATLLASTDDISTSVGSIERFTEAKRQAETAMVRLQDGHIIKAA